MSVEHKRQLEQQLWNIANALRGKIERFIAENLPGIATADEVPQSFDEYIQAERSKALDKLSEEEQLNKDGLQKVISDYLFTECVPLNDDVIGILREKPKLLARKTIAERVKDKILDFVETFFNGIPAVE